MLDEQFRNFIARMKIENKDTDSISIWFHGYRFDIDITKEDIIIHKMVDNTPQYDWAQNNNKLQ